MSGTFVLKSKRCTLERAEKFISDAYFTDVNLRGRLYPDKHPVTAIYHCAVEDRIPYHEAITKEFTKTEIGKTFGPTWSTHWFRIEFSIPKDWADKEVRLAWNSNSEALVWLDGRPIHGLNKDNHKYVSVSALRDGIKQTVFIEMACNSMFGAGSGLIGPPNPSMTFALSQVELVTFDQVVFELIHDIETLVDMATHISETDQRSFQSLYTVNSIVNACTVGDRESYSLARQIARKFFSDTPGSSSHTVHAMGHAHIDSELPVGQVIICEPIYGKMNQGRPFKTMVKTLMENSGAKTADKLKTLIMEQDMWHIRHCARRKHKLHLTAISFFMTGYILAWLWPYAETIRKCARSWSTTLQLMDRFPDFKFVCSQAQQYDWVKLHYPHLFEKIQRYSAKKEQFIPVGGVWVEMDGNLPSGESFVRQFLYGQRFFLREFQSKCNVFWLPDTFGYSAQLPQIIREAGIKYFVTQKLSWSLVNKFPHSTFWWEGIDGSRCLTHFPPADDYGTSAKVKDVLKTVTENKDKGRVNHSMLLFGHGDGGGGPSEEMLTRLERIKNVDGLPRVKQSTPQAFFESVESEGTTNLCTWIGELYLELHQGTFTTQAKIKKCNRRMEFLLRNVELAQSILLARSGKRGRYPSSQLHRLWQGLLLNQFHDVLPGSCIKQVVDDAISIYEDIDKTASELLDQGLKALVQPAEQRGQYCIFNPHSWWQQQVITLPEVQEDDMSPKQPKIQKHEAVTKDHSGRTLVLVAAPPMSLSSSVEEMVSDVRPVHVETCEGAFKLENEHLVALIDNLGRVVSLKHKETDREVFKTDTQGSFYGNQFVIFDDIPLFWDAWDVMDYHLETRKPITKMMSETRILDSSQLRCSIKTKLSISDRSWIDQVISLDSGSPYLRFTTEVHWHENHKFLKVEFPLTVRSTKATYDIQFGHLQRPTHFNTSWDSARYEVVGHKWADLSEHGFGVALLNDCKYGHSCHGNIMRLSLLRSPKSPDPTADMGEHQFTYAIMPHRGNFQESHVIQHAYNLNNSLVVFPGNLMSQADSFFTIDNPAVVIDTVKLAEDHEDVLVMRLFEAYGGQATTRICSSLPVQRAVRCNILEEPTSDNSLDGVVIQWKDGFLEITLTPFQIVSLLLYLRVGI